MQSRIVILGPGGTTQSCTYNVRGSTTTALNPCRIQTRTSTGTNVYNGKWLDILISVPTTYTCSTDCWWKVKYEFVSVSSGASVSSVAAGLSSSPDSATNTPPPIATAQSAPRRRASSPLISCITSAGSSRSSSPRQNEPKI